MPKWEMENNYSEKNENAIDKIQYLMENIIIGSRKDEDVFLLMTDLFEL